MRNHFNKDIRKYIHDTKRFLICPNTYRKQFLNDMEQDMDQFIQENPSFQQSDVIRYFGTPDVLAQTYLDSIPHEELVKYNYKRRYLITISLTVLISFFIILFLFLYYKSGECKVIYVEETIDILDESKQ